MRTDRMTVQMVVLFIGLSGLITITGLIVLAYLGRDIPEPLSTLGGAAIGALGTLLARTSTEEPGQDAREEGHERQHAPAPAVIPVEVTNPPGKPIPVESREAIQNDGAQNDGTKSNGSQKEEARDDGEWDEQQQQFYATALRQSRSEGEKEGNEDPATDWSRCD